MRTHVGIEATTWRLGGLLALVVALGVSGLLWALRPLPDGAGYSLGVQVSAVLLVVWVAWCLRPAVVQGWTMMLLVALAGIGASLVSLLTLDPDAEVVQTYGSLFTAISDGRNPYTCDCIVHLTPAGVRLGDFNYPPAEIWPYHVVHGLIRHWDISVLAATVVALNLAAFVVLLAALPRGRRLYALAFLPLLVPWVLGTTIGMTMVVTAAVVAVVLAGARRPRPWHRPALWLVFGIGILTKFAVIPLWATWWWWSAVRRARSAPRLGWGAAAADLLVPVGIALALCLPFGPASVVRNTLLFNAVLDRRSHLATFYPNVISGLTSWAGLERLYPVVACAALAAVVLVAPRFHALTAMLLTTTVFLLVSPTPEPQYLPVVILLFLAALTERERDRALARPAAPASAAGARPAPAPG